MPRPPQHLAVDTSPEFGVSSRSRTALLLASPRPLRAHRQRRPPAHPAQSRTPLRHSPAQWPLLCSRIDDILAGQTPLVADGPTAVEHEAQRIAAQWVARGTPMQGPAAGATDVQPVDVDSLRLVRPRSVGVEQVGLWALEQLGLPALLAELGVNGALRTAAAGAVVGRLAQPASERATHRWLQTRSGLGELLGVDFETVSPMQALPRLGRAGEAPRSDRGASVRPRHGPVRPGADRHPLRPDQHLFRRRGGARSRRQSAGTRKRSAATVRC